VIDYKTFASIFASIFPLAVNIWPEKVKYFAALVPNVNLIEQKTHLL